MLAIPAPATPPTNCRRDIVIKSSPQERYGTGAVFIDWGIYRTEAVNDQAITSACRLDQCCFREHEILMRCGIGTLSAHHDFAAGTKPQ
jgi:hypothetical protein